MKLYFISICTFLTILANSQSDDLTTKMGFASKIQALHIKKFNWIINQQLDSLQNLFHDELHYIHSNGWKESKAEIFEDMASGKLRYDDIIVHSSDVRLIDSTAVVTGKGTFCVQMAGKPLEFKLYYTEVYVITNQGVKLISRHACKDSGL